MAEFVALKGDSRAALRSSMTRLRGAWASMGPELIKANRSSVEWLNERAFDILDARVTANGRPQRDDARLLTALARDQIATVSRDGFRWGVASLLNKTSAGPYWRSIEEGSTLFVGKPFPVAVFPFGAERSTAQFRMIDPGDIKQARSKGKFTGGFVTAYRGPRIRRPIPAYHYLSGAVEDFIAQDIYTQELAKASAQWARVLAKARKQGVSAKAARG